MRKFISIMLAAAAALSLTACGGSAVSSGSSENSRTSSETAAATGEAPDSTSESAGSEEEKPLSNPVALTLSGNIDMETALAYETDFDALKASFDEKEVDPTKPVSENSSESTMEVWNYLQSVYGKQIITCQQMKDNKCTEDLVYYNATKDIPAMKGFDFIFSTGSYLNDDMIDDAIEWSKEYGGLVTFTWHWNVPKDIDDLSAGYAFYTNEIKNFSQINAVTPGTKEYKQVIHDIDTVAAKIQRMESEGVTILFRPLHEAAGSWFWWGVQNRDSVTNEVFQKLWYMIYDRMENYHKLTNIIWVWNGQSTHCAVHPNSYDIAGIDRYYDKTEHTAEDLAKYYDSCYNDLVKFEGKCAEIAGLESTGKMLALSECGLIPDPQSCVDNGNMWLYYMVWNGSFIYEADSAGRAKVDINGTPYPNTKNLTNEMLQEYFSNDAYITHGKLPEFSFGTKDIPQKIKNWEYFLIE